MSDRTVGTPGGRPTAGASRRPGWRAASRLAANGRILLLAAACLVMAAPFLWMAATSLMSQLEVFSSGRLLPRTPLWSNYPDALTAQPFSRYFLNSLVFAAAVVAGQVVTATTAGYAFARFDFPGRDRVFMLFLATMMV
ncbi:MAG: carbohydrate ABC transporter permease, partial [Gemmatimonadetes bacterium]|nr:carbohydrate ABC transporter permease [Gemmatimonadota bacterium]